MFDDDDKLIDFNIDKYADSGSLFDDDWLVADYEANFDEDDDDWMYEEYSDEEMEEYDNR